MITDSIQDSTRVVVGESRHGGVLPGTRAEMWRDVFLVPGADVRGPVWGNVVAAEGPGVRVRESVYARGAVRVTASDEGGPDGADVTFDGCVTTPDAIQVGNVPFRTRFLSNVYAGTVHLHNAIVYGNLYARSAVIRNSVILGGAFVAGRLTLADSVISTFRSRSARLEGTVSLLFPVAVCEEPMQIEGDLRALSFWALDPGRRGEPGTDGGVVTLTAGDVHAISATLGDDERRTFHFLSVDQRILDAQPLLESLRANRRALEGLSMLSHLDPEDAQALVGAEVGKLESALFDVVRAGELPEAMATRPLAEIAARSDVLSAIREYLSPEVARGVAAHSPRDGGEAALADGIPAEIAALFEPGPPREEPAPPREVRAPVQVTAPTTSAAVRALAAPPLSVPAATRRPEPAAPTAAPPTRPQLAPRSIPAPKLAAPRLSPSAPAGAPAVFEEELGAASEPEPLQINEDLGAAPEAPPAEVFDEPADDFKEDGI